MTKIPDQESLWKIGVGFAVTGTAFSIAWLAQGERYWWVPMAVAVGFYGFMWAMAWLFRNNP